ncbi:hypothetical protein GF312_02025 [Candidatus Poribacteria bacterium]|nr:hypothetical protein [Candidatus Poribacteria bacterium]
MIECSKCNAKYPTERLFCGKCKEPLGIRCHVCGFINLLDDLYCGICLSNLKEQRSGNYKDNIQQTENVPNNMYDELIKSVNEDEKTGGFGERLSQDDIDSIFEGKE